MILSLKHLRLHRHGLSHPGDYHRLCVEITSSWRRRRGRRRDCMRARSGFAVEIRSRFVTHGCVHSGVFEFLFPVFFTFLLFLDSFGSSWFEIFMFPSVWSGWNFQIRYKLKKINKKRSLSWIGFGVVGGWGRVMDSLEDSDEITYFSNWTVLKLEVEHNS